MESNIATTTAAAANSVLVEAQTRPNVDESDDTILNLNQLLLESIIHKNMEAYAALCAADLTCIEPESYGQVVEGLEFHLYFMRQRPSAEGTSHDINVLMTNAHVKRLGDGAAVVSYIRLQQQLDSETGKPVVVSSSETRSGKR